MERLEKLNYNEVLSKYVVKLDHQDCLETLENGYNHLYKVFTIEEKILDRFHDRRVDLEWAKSTLADKLGVYSAGLLYSPAEVVYNYTALRYDGKGKKDCPFEHVVVIEVDDAIDKTDEEIANYVLLHKAIDDIYENISMAMTSFIIFSRNGQLSGFVTGERLGFGVITSFREPVEDLADNYGLTYRFVGTMTQHELFRELPDEVYVRQKVKL